MARLAVFASGRGSNFVAIAQGLRAAGRHRLELLLCDRKGAPAFQRAAEMHVPALYVSYRGRPRSEAEREILGHLRRAGIQVVALAGFMRLLTPDFLREFPGPVLNLHPSLLPRHPGTHGIEESFRSEDRELGISIIRVDEGVDTGPILLQKAFPRSPGETLAQVEERIHALEHAWFPQVVLEMLDRVDPEPTREEVS